MTASVKQGPPRLGSILVRAAIGATALILLAALVLVVLELRYGNIWDGSPDDRLLAAMQEVAWGAQTKLDETGELPNSPEDALRALYPWRSGHWESKPSGLSYQCVQASGIRLCGEFSWPSSGQTTARPYSEYIVSLQTELAAPRPAGRHCYDIMLEVTEPTVREDALLFRELDAAATAAECTFMATGALPRTFPKGDVATARQLSNPACEARQFIGQSSQDIEYAPAGTASIRLCATFHRGYAASDKPARVFDPRRNARFGELAQARPELGRRCYAIAMLLPDPRAEAPASSWDEPIDVEHLPIATRKAAEQDKRAVGDLVNVLRLARCALTMSGAAPSAIQDAIKAVASRPRIAERYECGWVPSYFSSPENFPVAVYQPIDNERVRVCARFQSTWDQPLALNFYREALAEWPTSLPELQRPISGPGQHCFTVRLTAIGSGVT